MHWDIVGSAAAICAFLLKVTFQLGSISGSMGLLSRMTASHAERIDGHDRQLDDHEKRIGHAERKIDRHGALLRIFHPDAVGDELGGA